MKHCQSTASKYQITCSPSYRTVPSVTENYWKFLNTTKSHLHSHLHISFSAFYLPFFLYKLPASVTSHSSLFGQVPVVFWVRSHLEQSWAPCVKPVLQRPLSWGNKYSVVLDAIPAGGWSRESREGNRTSFQEESSAQVHWTQLPPVSQHCLIS